MLKKIANAVVFAICFVFGIFYGIFKMMLVKPLTFLMLRAQHCTPCGICCGIAVYHDSDNILATRTVGALCTFTWQWFASKCIVVSKHDRDMLDDVELHAILLHEVGHHKMPNGFNKDLVKLMALGAADYSDPNVMAMLDSQEMAADSYAKQEGYGLPLASALTKMRDELNLDPDHFAYAHLTRRINALTN